MSTKTIARDYGRIWQDLKAKYAPTGTPEHELRRIHTKWSSLGKLAQTGEKYR